jgi:hypothetical protein
MVRPPTDTESSLMPQSFASFHVHINVSLQTREPTFARGIRPRLSKTFVGILLLTASCIGCQESRTNVPFNKP